MMRKIPTLFVRDPATNLRYVTRDVAFGCAWVALGEGVATRKYDGTCCLVRNGRLFKRHEVKPGKGVPPGWFDVVEHDENTGKTVGWVAVGDGPEDRWHREAFHDAFGISPYRAGEWPDGTYELLGPKVQGNPEAMGAHVLLAHDQADRLEDAPRDYDGLAVWLHAHPFEGIVWHHPDGRMVKIKRRDFPVPTA